MYGTGWKIKLDMGTVIGMKIDKINGRCVTSVGVENIHHETEDRAQLNLTEDRLTSVEGALSPRTRVNGSDEMHSHDGSFNIYGRASRPEEVTMHLNGMVPPQR